MFLYRHNNHLKISILTFRWRVRFQELPPWVPGGVWQQVDCQQVGPLDPTDVELPL